MQPRMAARRYSQISAIVTWPDEEGARRGTRDLYLSRRCLLVEPIYKLRAILLQITSNVSSFLSLFSGEDRPVLTTATELGYGKVRK